MPQASLAMRCCDTSGGGTILWKVPLGTTADMTGNPAYRAGRDGKQFVVIAAGGHDKLGTRLGDSLIAFALP